MENFFKRQRWRRQISCGWPWKYTPWKQWSFHHDWTWKRSGFIWWVRKRFVSFFVKSMLWTFQIVWKLIHTNSKFQYVPISCELTVLNFIYKFGPLNISCKKFFSSFIFIRYTNRRTMSSSDRTLINAFRTIAGMCDRINLPRTITDRANTYYFTIFY